MKTIAVLIAMFLGALMNAQTEKSGNITASVSNISNADGEVLFAMYTEDTFMKRQPEFVAKSDIVNGKATAVFENVPEGVYAIVVLHDKNKNGKMDFGPGGMPQENYGTSNNSMIYGPPNWGDSKFDFDGSSMEMDIRF
ncbi:DUF2141 domain-containing protein [Christiangramia sp. SM2212]|uniref:DUF2141 domain-containing protein n=1 Tax=Christiangramia sediminicola TaxID=3073267 RepID=A0ABU1ENL4_9FLAO|nr:DUF2141 domain-containing protein [Christiangramia sp. SM2212]MDR5589980.1 DUF2141 domain-containing protein [Christiangramia sp. SM2212]